METAATCELLDVRRLMVIGIDIGGTKCGVAKADEQGNILGTRQFKTTGCQETLAGIVAAVEELEPTRFPTTNDQDDSDNSEDPDGFGDTENTDGYGTNDTSDEINPAATNSIDPLTGQFNLFE